MKLNVSHKRTVRSLAFYCRYSRYRHPQCLVFVNVSERDGDKPNSQGKVRRYSLLVEPTQRVVHFAVALFRNDHYKEGF
jgi:hypothetical protein